MSLAFNVGSSEYGFNVLRVTYQDHEDIEIELTNFYKDQGQILMLYVQINEYLATLPEYAQKEIYEEISKIYVGNYYQNYHDHNFIIKLENKIAKVSELLNYENFKLWISYREDQIPIPDSIKRDYIYDPDMNTTEEKTYIHKEYRDLIALIMFIRMLSPLYIDYYNYISPLTPHYYYKIFMLLIKADIYQSEEIAKLKRYIEANQQTLVGNSKNEHLIINAGLSDDDILDSLIGEIIFNKLLTIDLFTKQCNIVSYVFQTIRFKGSFISSDAQAIRSKKTTSDPTKEDISYFEDYRKTSNIPIGTVVEIQHAVSDINFLVASMGNVNFDFKQYQKDISNLSPYMEVRIDKTQIYLLGWFISKIINPRALFYIEYVKLVELMLFAKNILLNNGQEFFGTLFGCYKHRGHNFINVIIRSGISKQLLKRLSEFYVHTLEDEKQSVIEKTITEASKEIVNSLWVPYDLECLPSNQINKDGFLVVPNNITDIVCNYVEFINSSIGVPANV